MTLERFVVQLYKGEFFATEESKRSLHVDQGKAKATDNVRISVFYTAICSLHVYKYSVASKPICCFDADLRN